MTFDEQAWTGDFLVINSLRLLFEEKILRAPSVMSGAMTTSVKTLIISLADSSSIIQFRATIPPKAEVLSQLYADL